VEASSSSAFTPVNFRKYSGNAMMTLQLTASGKPVANAELGVFADDECRAAAMTDQDGVAYLTIPGDDAAQLTFKVADGDEVTSIPSSLYYETDAIYGSPLYPLVIDLEGTTGIENVVGNERKEEFYDLQGRKQTPNIFRLNKGVYIVNGKKQAVIQ
jgi:hypothetical protein